MNFERKQEVAPYPIDLEEKKIDVIPSNISYDKPSSKSFRWDIKKLFRRRISQTARHESITPPYYQVLKLEVQRAGWYVQKN